MDPKAPKNRRLIKQYPFVSEILSRRMEPHGGLREGIEKKPGWVDPTMKIVDDLTISVERADGELMYSRANNVGLGESSCIFQLGDSRKDQVMRRGEYVYAINASSQIINSMGFPRNNEERRGIPDEPYAWWVLWRSRQLNASQTGYLHSDPLLDETKYIVWVTVEAWHTDTKDDNLPNGRFGAFRDRSVHITIYGEPDGGFRQLQENLSVYESLQLDERLMTRGMIAKDHDLVTIGGMLYEMCITFQDLVYFNGMKAVLDKGKYCGASGQFGPVKVLCAEMCGYDRVMLEDPSSYVTFQLRPGSKHMYVLGQQGTVPQIRNLVRTVVRMWNQEPAIRAAFQPDKDVSVM